MWFYSSSMRNDRQARMHHPVSVVVGSMEASDDG